MARSRDGGGGRAAAAMRAPAAASRARACVLALVACALCASGPLAARPAPSDEPATRGAPGGGSALDAAELSRLDLPIEASLAALRDAVERRVPAVIDRSAQWTMVANGRIGLKFRLRRGPIALGIDGETVRGHIDATYALEACVRLGGTASRAGGACVPIARCETATGRPPRVTLSFTTRLRWTPEWGIASHTRIAPLAFDGGCLIGPEHTDVSATIAQLLEPRLRRAVADLDARVAAVPWIRGRAQEQWARLQAPIAIGPNAWLLLRPQGVEAGPLHGDGARVATQLSLTARPVVRFGPRPPPTAPVPLPALGAAPREARGFHAEVAVEMPASEASAQLDRALSGRTYRLAARPVRVRAARVFVDGARAGVVLDVTFRAGLFRRPRGRIYLSGVPWYDPAARAVRIAEPHLTVQSLNLVRGLGGWLFASALEHLVADKARFALGPRLDRLHAELTRVFNRPVGRAATVATRIDSLRVLGVGARGDALVGRVAADGTASVQLDVSALGREAR